jgi:hypothetical protein
MFRRYDDQEAVELLTRIAATDTSNRVREMAEELLLDKRLRREADNARQALPDDLREKTERHPGKWVAIADGRIISADRFRGQIRRDIRGTNNIDALVVWVPERPT